MTLTRSCPLAYRTRMTTYYRSLEIKKDGEPTGKYRKVAHNTSFTIAHALCSHEHDSVEEADRCPDIQEEMDRAFHPSRDVEDHYADIPLPEPLLQFFTYAHLPSHLQEISRPFSELARDLVRTLPNNPERTKALDKLLESKDCAVRASMYKSAEVIRHAIETGAVL